jgi:hypothetical protein
VLRDVGTTVQPARPSSTAMVFPAPRDAPVTTAIRDGGMASTTARLSCAPDLRLNHRGHEPEPANVSAAGTGQAAGATTLHFEKLGLAALCPIVNFDVLGPCVETESGECLQGLGNCRTRRIEQDEVEVRDSNRVRPDVYLLHGLTGHGGAYERDPPRGRRSFEPSPRATVRIHPQDSERLRISRQPVAIDSAFREPQKLPCGVVGLDGRTRVNLAMYP